MFSVIIGLIICGIGLLRGTDLVTAADYSLNVVWWTDLILTLWLVVFGFLLFLVGILTATGKTNDYSDLIGKAGLSCIFSAMIFGVIEMFGLTLICSGISPTEVTNLGMVVIGTLLWGFTSRCYLQTSKDMIEAAE